eukprot:comp10036_c0_seq1/m.4902 comp10036_c0_seq1/g.4902  ORF comp10036_c0_seq1/g.4902 comp10036_c0_seq1/m.4902 type:complete len:298 (-) comp10036_c0_seq1:398-1291(-)
MKHSEAIMFTASCLSRSAAAAGIHMQHLFSVQRCLLSGKATGRGLLSKKALNGVKGASQSSTQWLKRQLSDPYVRMATTENYRSRSAFKLVQLDDKFGLLKRGMTVIDCGACPGGWTQVAVKKVGAVTVDPAGVEGDESVGNPQETKPSKKRKTGRVISVDLQEIQPIPGATIIDNADFLLEETHARISRALNGEKADVVLSDMTPNSIGIPSADFLRVINLAESLLVFSTRHLREGGSLVLKLRGGGCDKEFKSDLKKYFKTIRHAKPDASRKDSSEYFLVATEFSPSKNGDSPSS